MSERFELRVPDGWTERVRERAWPHQSMADFVREAVEAALGEGSDAVAVVAAPRRAPERIDSGLAAWRVEAFRGRRS